VVSSPGTQGIIGFTDLRDTFDLPAATVVVESKFVSLLLSSLDQLPLRISRRILITAMARDAQKGAEYGIGGMTLDRLGGPPLMMEPVRASLTFKGEPVTEAAPLTTGGLRTGRALAREGNRITIDGRHATFYYEVIRGPAEEPAVDAGPGAEDAGRPPGPVSDAGQGEEVDAPPPAPDGAANEDAPTRPSAGGDSAGSGCGACSMAEGGPEWGWALWLLYPLVRRVPLLRSNRRWGRPSASPCRAGHPGPARLVTR